MLRDERFYYHSYADISQRDLWEFTLRRSTSHYPTRRRDLIFTPIFTSFFTASFAATATGQFVIGALSAIASTAVTIGLQAIMAPKPPKPEDGKVPKTQGIPPRFWAVGTNRMAGAYMLWESRGKRLFSVQAIVAHLVAGFRGFWFHDDRVELSDIDPVTGRTLFDDDDRYGDNVSIWWRKGQRKETAYSEIVEYLGEEGIWTDDHRGDGQASIGVVCRSIGPEHQSERFPYGPLSVSTEVDGAYVFDFRIDTDPSNPDAWVFSKNSVLGLCWHLCFNPLGHRRDFATSILPVIDMWQEEADVCDEDVPRAGGGSEKRYECNGFDSSENDPKVGTNAILATCDGWICERGDGALLIIVGKFREKYVAEITDADILGYTVHYGVLPEAEINRLKPTFTYPAIGYATAETRYFENLDAIETAGRVLAEPADYRFVQQWRQAVRLGLRDWKRIELRCNGSLDLRLSAVNSVYTRWTRMNTPLSQPRLYGKIIENRKSTLALLKGGFSMEFSLHPDDIDNWNPGEDEGQAPPVPPQPNFEGILTPVINLLQAKARGSSVYIRVDIIDPEDDSLDPFVEYRLQDNGSGNPGAWIGKVFPNVTPAGGYIQLNTDVVPSNSDLDIRVSFKTSKGTGDPCPVEQITSTTDNTKPAAPTSLNYSTITEAFSARAANTTSSQGRTAYLTFKMGLTTDSYDGAAELDKLAAQPGDLRSVPIVSPGSGLTRRLWCNSENISGLVCDTPAHIDVTFP